MAVIKIKVPFNPPVKGKPFRKPFGYWRCTFNLRNRTEIKRLAAYLKSIRKAG